jgi:hypothetical protein
MMLSICQDVALLKEHALIKVNGEDTPLTRSIILGTGGTNTFYNGNSSIVGLSGLGGLDEFIALDCITITSYEEIFGYRTVEVSEEGVEYIVETPAVPEMRTLYDSIYTRTPIVTEDGTYTPPALMGISGGYNTSHLTNTDY